MTRLRVLVCAFACAAPGTEGFTGGESALGWSMLRQIARFHEVWALTREVDRLSIERTLEQNPILNLHFCYFDLPSWFLPLLRIQGGHQIYYWLWQIKAYFVARKLHKSVEFELFHHVTYANDWMTSYIGALLPVPYIRGPGGGAHKTPQQFLNQYSMKGRIWERLRTAGQWLFRHDPFFVIGQNRARAILVCNREAMEALPERWRKKAYLFSVNGVSSADLDLYQPANPTDGTFRVISAGKLLRIKGFNLAIQAFTRFSGNHPEAQLTIVGDGPELQHLQEIINRLGAEDKVKFEQWMPRPQLLMKMATSDVFLFPALRDGGGAVVIEAMAMGKPVICLDIGGPGMHVTGDCGVKIAATNPERAVEEMSAALERLYVDSALRKSLGEAARERAMLVYHWDRAGERLQDIINS